MTKHNNPATLHLGDEVAAMQNEPSPPRAESLSPLEPAAGVSPAATFQAAAPDPFDPAQFAANSTVLGGVGVTKELVTCPVRKPNKQEFVRVHPGAECQLRAHILDLKEEPAPEIRTDG